MPKRAKTTTAETIAREISDEYGMSSSDFAALVENCGVRIHNNVLYRSELKGIVERFFNQVKREFIVGLPGAKPQNK